jgi:GNAT superfamily N-acetyltransferase
MKQTHIREATAADLPALLAFEQGVVESERPYDSSIKAGSVHYYDLAELIVRADSLVLVAEIADQLIATGHSTLKKSAEHFEHDRHAYLGLMFVDPSYRGQGLIQRIIEGLLAWARGEGIKDFFLDVYPENDAAVRAYEKFGFRANMLEMTLRD